jgi:hypothetical protein
MCTRHAASSSAGSAEIAATDRCRKSGSADFFAIVANYSERRTVGLPVFR